MKALIEKIRVMIFPNGNSRYKIRQKSKAQSMVEFAVLLPFILTLFLGLVEFGFMLNTYLSLLDATRQAARLYSNSNPFTLNSSNVEVENPAFFSGVAQAVIDNLNPPMSVARQIPMDSTLDDILVSAISVDVDTTADPDVISTITHHTDFVPGAFYSFYGNGANTKYDDATIETYMTANGAIPVKSGLLIVELYYSYEGVLGISTKFIDIFAPNKHIMLYSSTIMPLVSVRPVDPTPTP